METMKTYLEIVDQIIKDGSRQENRTGIDTFAVPNVHFSHNMSEGFPLLTTKKMAFKAVRVELEGFIKGITDKRWFQERGCKIWREWASPTAKNSDGIQLQHLPTEERKSTQILCPDLGPLGYSHQLRAFGGKYPGLQKAYTLFDKTIEIINNEDKLVGAVIEGTYGSCTIISYDGTNKQGRKQYSVKFHETGYIKRGVTKTQINNKIIVDPYYPTICGIACIGMPQGLDTNIMYKLRSMWKRIIYRCYNKHSIDYTYYGQRGVTVEDRWLTFENFVEDIQSITNWEKKLTDWSSYDLDKDIKGDGFQYSKENCIWVSKSTNSIYRLTNFYFDAISPDNKTYANQIGVKQFCHKHNLSYKAVLASIKNNTLTQNGWKFIKKRDYKNTKPSKGYDQLQTIVNTLKTNPNDRRMVVNYWNPNEIHRMSLPPCHMTWILTHINGVLNLHWTQRSCDVMLGLPFNIASYALLLTLLAETAGMTPGNLSAMLCNAHIYENHMEKAKEQLKREPLSLPELKIKNNSGSMDNGIDIFKWTYEDVELCNYKHHPKIDFGGVAV